MPVIYHVIGDREMGGAGIFLQRLLSVRRPDTGSPVLLPKGSPLFSHLRAKGIPALALPLDGTRSFSLHDTGVLFRFFKSRPPSLVVSHASLSARVAARLLCLPTVSVRHCDTDAPVFPWLYRLFTDATVATSLHAKKRLKAGGVRPVFFVENGAEPHRPASPEERLAAREELRLPTDALIFGISGRLSPVKGQSTAIRALSRLTKRGTHAHLALLGVGESEASLRALAMRLGISKQVHFLGFRADTAPFYRAIDAHLCCSTGSETSSLALAEGMCYALPTLATDIPGNRARVKGGGLYFPVRDDAALASLLFLLTDASKRETLALCAKKRSESLPTWERVRTEYGAVFSAFSREIHENSCFFSKFMLQ